MMSSRRNLEKLVVGGKYSLIEEIGSGAFGSVYLATNVTNEKEKVAVKIERKIPGEVPLLPMEYRVYEALQGGGAVVPQIKWFGMRDSQHDLNVMVMELLGPSLRECFEQCSGRFGVKTVLMVADQILHNMECLHERNYLHRDIKPENFAVGLGQKSYKVYMIDFGFAKTYRDPWRRKHVQFTVENNLVGTARYVSVNVHEGHEQGRSDDLEAVGYMLIYFLMGSLPWQNLKARGKYQKYRKIKELKISTPLQQLCKDLPSEFMTYLNYCRHLRFNEAPNYRYLRQLFQKLFRKLGYQNDGQFDWTMLEEKDETNPTTLKT